MTPRHKKLTAERSRKLEKALQLSMSEEEKRALRESLEEAERDIRAGRYIIFDPQTTFNDLRNKTIAKLGKE